jgi:LuxR family transcriptional regulator of csgAB operon
MRRLGNGNSNLYSDAVLYIIGKKNFQNELFERFLSQELNVSCILDTEIERVQNDENLNEINKVLVLFDVAGKDLSRIFLELNGIVKDYSTGLILSFYNMDYDTGFEIDALRYGVKGFFYINDTLELMVKGIKSIIQGELWVSRELLSECVVEDMKPNHIHSFQSSKQNLRILSKRETEILGMVAVGAKNDEIADKLCISPHTVKTHLYNIYKKIRVGDRLQAVLWAAKHLK